MYNPDIEVVYDVEVTDEQLDELSNGKEKEETKED